MTVVKPSARVLRSLTDENVLAELMSAARLTRAELAVTTGLSKPTVAESVRRLEAAGLIADTGERTTGRGGVGTYYALSADVGVALAVSISPGGVVAEVVDPAGSCLSRATEPVARPATSRTVDRLLAKTVKRALGAYEPAVVRTATVSAADPVDRTSGAVVHLPDAPFMLGALAPVTKLEPFVAGPVLVDNDVNWAARGERDARASADAGSWDDFVYLYLDEGLGCAVVADGDVRRGHAGLTGEIAHVLTTGPDGRATPFIEVFDQLGLRHDGTTAINVPRLCEQLTTSRGGPLAAALAHAVLGVVRAAVAFANPSTVVIGGSWGPSEPVFSALVTQCEALARPVPLVRAAVEHEPALTGARRAAIDALRDDLLDRARSADAPLAGRESVRGRQAAKS